MRLHPSAVNKLIYLCKNYGGHQHESKLKGHIDNVSLSAHIDKNGQMWLVETQLLLDERNQRRLEVADIIPMKFHPSLVAKILSIYEMYSGHANERKLMWSFTNLDLTPYERIVTGNDTVLVLTEDYVKVMQSVGRKG